MPTEIYVNVDQLETRAAIVEDGRLVELHYERSVCQRYAGNIYLGRVENVLPGMQAAFVDIGLERNAFLYVDDAKASDFQGAVRSRKSESIQEILHPGQNVIVQVTKEPIGAKGARVTTDVTIPGRYLVLMPTVSYVGISRRVEGDAERDRLRQAITTINRQGMGVIVRTAAEGTSEAELSRDMEFLSNIWSKIQTKSRQLKAPSLLYREYDLVYRIVRDLLAPDVDRIVIDDASEYRRLSDFISTVAPSLQSKIRHYTGKVPLFEYAGLESEIQKCLRRKVWLDCGGYLIIDNTEALTSIDVNTGKYIGTTSLADTVFKTNMEAAVEIARQLRLRNTGGIIVIDFIDMDSSESREKVLSRLKEELAKDKTRSNVLGFTGLGLVEMTRKKVRQSTDDILTKPCPYCDGRGRVQSEATVAIAAERRLRELAAVDSGPDSFLVEAHPSVAALLIGVGGQNLERLESSIHRKVFIKGRSNLHVEDVDITPLEPGVDVDSLIAPVSGGQVLSVVVEERHTSNEHNGIARVDGYVLDIDGAGDRVGEKIDVQVTRVFRTYARAVVVAEGDGGESREGGNA